MSDATDRGAALAVLAFAAGIVFGALLAGIAG